MATRTTTRKLAARTNPEDCSQFPHDPLHTKIEVRGWSRTGQGETWHCRECGVRVI